MTVEDLFSAYATAELRCADHRCRVLQSSSSCLSHDAERKKRRSPSVQGRDEAKYSASFSGVSSSAKAGCSIMAGSVVAGA